MDCKSMENKLDLVLVRLILKLASINIVRRIKVYFFELFRPYLKPFKLICKNFNTFLRLK